MFGKRCTLCGGKLDSHGVCKECGLDNNKNDKNYRVNQSSCDNQPLTHVHEEKHRTEPVRRPQPARPAQQTPVLPGFLPPVHGLHFPHFHGTSRSRSRRTSPQPMVFPWLRLRTGSQRLPVRRYSRSSSVFLFSVFFSDRSCFPFPVPSQVSSAIRDTPT